LVCLDAPGLAGKQQELAKVRQQLDRLVDAIAEGTPAATVRERMTALERRRQSLETELATAEDRQPGLHPALAAVYRDRIACLAAALEDDDAAQARERIRASVEAIRLIPEDGRLRVQVHGALGAILALAEVSRNDKRPGHVPEALLEQIKMDAGTRIGLCRTRLR
jgi:hypothetical protein